MSDQSKTTLADIPRLPGFKVDEQPGQFITRRPLTEKQIIEAGRRLLAKRFVKDATLNSPDLTRDYLRFWLGGKEHEVFAVLFLNSQHRVIEAKEMFHGTIDGASIYPREVVKTALELNAAAVILAHNHPSGDRAPSEADRQLTHRLRQALALVDVRVLDHFIAGDGDAFSFAEHGLI